MQELSKTRFTPRCQIALATFFRCSANCPMALKTSGSMPSFGIARQSGTFLSASRKHVRRWNCDTCAMWLTITGSIGNTRNGFYRPATSMSGCDKAGEASPARPTAPKRRLIDLTSGYMISPVDASIRARLKTAAVKHSVPVDGVI